jgi:hypothetical protein
MMDARRKGPLMRRRPSLPLKLAPGLLLALAAQAAAQTSTTGTITVSATVSGYVDVASGGNASLSGSSGGSITNNKTKGQVLTGLTINLGELGAGNPSSFVKATVPLRLRSNASYSLTMGATQLPTGDPNALLSSDIGFGLANISRADTNVLAGVDTPATGVSGDPTLDADAVPGTDRWDYSANKRLSDYSTAKSILSGARVMKPVPISLLDGLVFNTFFCVKPQFFTPATFSSTVTFTISTP